MILVGDRHALYIPHGTHLLLALGRNKKNLAEQTNVWERKQTQQKTDPVLYNPTQWPIPAVVPVTRGPRCWLSRGVLVLEVWGLRN